MPDSRDFISFDEIDKDGPQTFHRTIDLTPADLDRVEVSGMGPVTLDAAVQKGDLPGEYLVEGTESFTADFTCSRCLEPYPFAHSSAFHLRFRPRPELSEENAEVEIAPDELDVEFYRERSIPLRDLAIEQIQLTIPMKPLCEESCLGLCPHCGANRNREGCDCAASLTDERWGVLAGIREELAKKKDV
jgi:uncharacterized protein